METLSLSIDFVSASAETTSQTGDLFSWTLILGIIAIALFGVIGLCKYWKINFAPAFHLSNNSYKIRTNKHTIGVYPYTREGFIVVVALFAIVLSILCCGLFGSGIAVGAPPLGQNLTPDVDKITATVQDDGSINFSTCNLKNASGKLITLETAAIEVAEESKSIAAINSCELTINSFGGCVYKGMPDGQERKVTGCSSLDDGQSTPLSIELTNLDRQSALDLCGKKVFTLKFTPQPSTIYRLETDGYGSWIEDEAEVNLIEVPGYEVPEAGQMLTYTGLDGESHSVTATPDTEYNFGECRYDSESKTFTAIFGYRVFDIHYLDQGGAEFSGTHETGHPEKHTYGTDTTLKGATKTGYIFGGWYLKQDCSDNEVTVLGATEFTDAINLYAKWTVNQYTITFDTDGGSEVAPISQDYGTPITAPEDPNKTGYTFAGWNPTIPTTMPAESLTCTAQWTANVYKITLTAGEGTSPGTTAIYEKYNNGWFSDEGCATQITSITKPAKTGYTFAGYKSGITEVVAADGTITGSTTIFTDVKELTAEWSANIYTITLNQQGATTEGTKTLSVAYDKPVPSVSALPQKTGYTFGGYYTEVSGGGEQYFNEQGESKLEKWTQTSGITLYAKWDINKFTVSFSNNGHESAEGMPEDKTDVPYDSKIDKPSPDPSDTGYEFKGWFKESTCVNEWKFSSDTVKDNITLYAKWTANVYTITLNGGEGATTKGTQTIYEKYNTGWFSDEGCASKITSITIPTKTGYTFAGYKSGETVVVAADGKINDSTTIFTDAKVLTADWTANVYKITLTAGQGTSPGTTDIYEKYNTGWFSDVDCKTQITTINIPTKTSYTFAGYKSGEIVVVAVDGKINESTTLFTAAQELTAEWVVNKEYKLETDGHGLWKDEDDEEVSSITILGETVPDPGETITYKGIDWKDHSVQVIPNADYRFVGCAYDKDTTTFTASFLKVVDYTLATNENGSWKEGNNVVTKITVAGELRPLEGESITYTDPSGITHLVNAVADSGYAFSGCDFADRKYTASFVFGHPVDYAVSIWNIEQNADGTDTITFGPATGSDYDTAIGKKISEGKVITDNWNEIKQAGDNGTAHTKYATALAEGYVKIITINLNDKIYKSSASSKNACSILYDSIKDDYKTWNNSFDNPGSGDDPASQYGTSRIRATLNGSDNAWDPFTPHTKFAGSDCLTSSNCLLSCFPEIIQNNITERTFQSSTKFTNSSPDYNIWESKFVTDKLWLPNSREVFGTGVQTNYGDYEYIVQKYGFSGITDSDRKGYTESKESTDRWLRNPNRSVYTNACRVTADGSKENHNVMEKFGLSPCFCMGGNSTPLKRIDFTVREKINGVDTTVTYYPVFDSVPEGVTFYDSENKEVKQMDSSIKYAIVKGDANIQTVRSVNVIAWDATFDQESDVYGEAYKIKDSFKSSKLVAGDKENVVFKKNSEMPAKINNVSLYDIYKAYNPSRTVNGFGSSEGFFWSCISYQDNQYSPPKCAWRWSCNSAPGGWSKSTIGYTEHSTTLVKRDFNGTTFALSSDGNGKWMEGDEENTFITLPDEGAAAPISDPNTGAITYTGIDGKEHTVTPVANDGCFYNSSSYCEDGKAFNASFVVKSVATVKYVVSIWGINHDGDPAGSVAFGPATDASSCPDHQHKDGEGCIHNDSWETIIENLKSNPTYYQTCLEKGCTKEIELDLNSVIANASYSKPDARASVLFDSINSDYIHYNMSINTSDCETSNYAKSRIRATLNGYKPSSSSTEVWWAPSTYAGDNCLTGDTCLLSCFPEVLQNSIIPRTFNVSAHWNTSTHAIDSYPTITDKLWLPNGSEVFGKNKIDEQHRDYGDWYSRFTYKSSDTFNKCYKEDGGSYYWWLRSPNRGYAHYVSYVYNDGKLSDGYVNWDYGIAPCFCIGKQPEPIEYKLETDKHGEWQENGEKVESITVLGDTAVPPEAGQTIKYNDLEGHQHTVTATPTGGYKFDECTYDSGTKTFTAKWKPTLDAYSLDELKEISEDISKNKDGSEYYEEFYNYMKNDEIWYGSNGTYDPDKKEVTENMKQYCCSFITDADGSPVECNINNYLFLRIIGINHDYKAGSTSKRAGLTFQVVHALPQAYAIGEGVVQWWGVSPLRNNMQEGGEIFSSLNSKFINSIISVDKYTQQDRGGTANVYTTQDKMFLLSYGEMWQNTGGDKASQRSWLKNGRDDIGRQSFDPSNPATEGYCYEWHWNKAIKGEGDNSVLANAQLCNDGNVPIGNVGARIRERSVWTSSNDRFIYMSDNGNPSYDDTCTSVRAVRPCFCLGTSTKYTVTLDDNGGSGGQGSVKTSYGDVIPNVFVPTLASSVFSGYYDSAVGGTKYIGSDGKCVKNWDKTADTTLYAQWEPATYNVAYSYDTQGLPSGFIELEYIESNRNQYIDTGVNGQGVYQVDFEFTDNVNKNTWDTLLGCYDGTREIVLRKRNVSGSSLPKLNVVIGRNELSLPLDNKTYDVYKETRVTAKLHAFNDYQKAEIYGQTIAEYDKAPSGGSICASRIFLFEHSENGSTMNRKIAAKLYSAQFYSDKGETIMTRDFVPAEWTNADITIGTDGAPKVSKNGTILTSGTLTKGTKGLFDRANNVFYISSTGTNFEGSIGPDTFDKGATEGYIADGSSEYTAPKGMKFMGWSTTLGGEVEFDGNASITSKSKISGKSIEELINWTKVRSEDYTDNPKKIPYVTLYAVWAVSEGTVIFHNNSSPSSELPTDLTRVEYLENTGGSYIDSWYRHNRNTEYDIKALDYGTVSGWEILFGARDVSSTADAYDICFNKYGKEVGYNVGGATNNCVYMGLNANTAYRYYINRDKMVINGGGLSCYTSNILPTSGDNPKSPSSNPPTDFIFGCNVQGKIRNTEPFKGRIYSFKIFDENGLQRDFIPVVTNVDDIEAYKLSTAATVKAPKNTPGLWDRVEGKLYINCGSDNFNYPKIGDVPIPYVDNTPATGDIQGWNNGNAIQRFNDDVTEGYTRDSIFCEGILPEAEGTSLQAQGYIFTGWNTRADGSGKHYDDRSKLSELVMDGAGVIDLYAEWTPNKYNVSFDNQGHGGSTPPTMQVTYGAPYGQLPTLSESGLVFGGWYLDSECTGSEVTSTTKVKTAENHTLYAKWFSGITYTLATDGKGKWMEGDSEVNQITVAGGVRPIEGESITYTDPDGVTHVVNTVANNNFVFSACEFDNKTYTASFASGHPVDYAVSIWNIEQKADGTDTITFGPATGSSYDTAIGNASKITDNWNEIKKACDEGTAHTKYATALAEGHVKIITLNLNDTIYSGTAPSKAGSILYNSIKETYRMWNNITDGATFNNPATQYDKSRIRATLNGHDDWNTSTYAGSNCLTSSNCLLSCFPDNVKNNIKARTFKSAVQWSTTSPYAIVESKTVEVSDKLWLATGKEVYLTTDYHDSPQFFDYGSLVQKYYGKAQSDRIGYTESGTAENWWFRNPARHEVHCACRIYSNGVLTNHSLVNLYGISPCFNIGGDPKPLKWQAMQAEIQNGNKIDFYPAFNSPTEVAGYRFAVKNGDNFVEVQPGPSGLKMSDIYKALRQPASGEATATLYYAVADSGAPPLKGYAVKNFKWNDVFGTKITSGKATDYSDEFKHAYQLDSAGNINGIKTALITSEGFGSDWDVSTVGSNTIPKLNGVDYLNSISGFYESYGKAGGGILPNNSQYPWGSSVKDAYEAYSFAGGSTRTWGTYSRSEGNFGVALARSFNDISYTYDVALNDNGGSGGQSSVKATYGFFIPDVVVPTNASGVFNGYFDSAVGGTKYIGSDGKCVKNWDKKSGGNLYAQWLPLGFTGLNYLESNTTQYIDVGLKPTVNMRVVTKYNKNNNGSVFGVLQSGNNFNLTATYTNTSIRMHYKDKENIDFPNVANGIDIIADFYKGCKLNIGGVIHNWNFNTLEGTISPSYNMYVFGRCMQDGFNDGLIGKIYYMQIYSSYNPTTGAGELAYDFVPAEWTNDDITIGSTGAPDVSKNGIKQTTGKLVKGTKGFYDKINNMFYISSANTNFDGN